MTPLRRFLLGGILALSLLAGGLHYAGVNEIVAFTSRSSERAFSPTIMPS